MVDYGAVRRLSKANAESCRDMTQELKRLAVLAGIGHEEIGRRMMRPNLAIRVETNSDAMTVDDLRAYATAVGARLTFTVEADPDVEAGA